MKMMKALWTRVLIDNILKKSKSYLIADTRFTELFNRYQLDNKLDKLFQHIIENQKLPKK